MNYDEANFLTLARGATLDPWAPHNVLINWQGRTERAFDVLSNPPGIAWFLALVQAMAGDGVLVQRAAVALWLIPAAFGAMWLSGAFSAPGEVRLRATALLAMPMVVLSASALLPDGPLYAVTLLGMGGVARAVREGRSIALWAFVAGCGCLFRYSGVCLIPLVVLLGQSAGATWVIAPLALLIAHDIAAYGQPHILAMGHFQAVSETALDWGHKAASALTFLGGAVVLPLFGWDGLNLLGAVVGAIGAIQFGAGGWLTVEAGVFGAAGGATFASVVRAFAGDGRERWLGVWGAGGFAFLLLLRFTAARYWLPFAPAIVLLCPPGGIPAIALGGALGVALLADDADSARAVAYLTDRVIAIGETRGKPGMFTGHWGWQWALEQHGWKALDEGAHAPPGTLLAVPTEAWPQPVDAACVDVLLRGEADVSPAWLPRAYSAAGRANLHANWIAGPPALRTVIPWTFATDRYEAAEVCLEP